MPVASTTTFGRQLRAWRARSGLTQLQLAAEAGTTPRHVSFVETGRSRPGRELVLRLARVLDVPVRERNALLQAAGLAPAYPELSLEDDELSPVRQALEKILQAHEPYPAWVMGRGLRFLRSNAAAERLLPGMCELTPEAAVDVWFGDGPQRALVENWAEVAAVGLFRLRQQVERTADPELQALLERAQGHVRRVELPDPSAIRGFPVIGITLRIGERRVRTFTTVLQFDNAVEVTASELRVEMMFPADAASDAFFRDSADVA